MLRCMNFGVSQMGCLCGTNANECTNKKWLFDLRKELERWEEGKEQTMMASKDVETFDLIKDVSLDRVHW